MVQHIYNKLAIKGNINNIKNIIGTHFRLSNTINTNNQNEQWNLEHWSTPQEIFNVDLMIKEDYTIIYYESITNAPLEWLIRTARIYPDLEFYNYWYNKDNYPLCGKISVKYKDIHEIDYDKNNYNDASHFINEHFPQKELHNKYINIDKNDLHEIVNKMNDINNILKKYHLLK